MNIGDARERAAWLLAKINSAAERGNQSKVNKLICKYLRSPAAMYYAAFRVLGHAPRPLSGNSGGTPEQQVALAQQRQASHNRKIERLVARIDLSHRNQETVHWWRVEKRRGPNGERRFRVLCDLSLRLRVQHLMIKDALLAAFRPGEHIYDLKGRGKDIEASQILAAVAAGYGHAYVGDIESSFDSFSREAFSRLPLPNVVVRWNLLPENLRLVHSAEREGQSIRSIPLSTDRGCPSCSGPRGLIQGSPASNIIQSWVFHEAHTVVPRDCWLFILSDNVVLLCRNEDDLASGIENLKAHFASNRGGPFNLVGETFGPDQPFPHMGYEFAGGGLHGPATVSFDPSRLAKLIRGLAQRILTRCDGRHITLADVSEAIERTKSGYNSLSAPDSEWQIVDLWVLEELERRANGEATSAQSVETPW